MVSTWVGKAGKAVWNGRRLDAWVPQLVDELVEVFEPVEIWLYGSVARGADDGDSDIDLLIVLHRYDPSDAIDLATRALRAATIPAPFDVAFTDPARFATRSAVPGTIERAALLGGRCVRHRG